MTQQQVLGRVGILRVPEGQQSQIALDPLSAQLVSQLLPPLAQLAAAGKIFTIDMSGGTAKAPVVAMPVASPEWGLYNASLTETMFVLRAAFVLESGTAGLGLAIVGAAAKGPQTVVAADYAATEKTRTNGETGGPEVFLQNNPTLIGGTPAWHSFEGTKINSVATNSVGDAIVADIAGALVAKPGGGMVAFEAVGETGSTALFDFQALIAMVNMS